MKKIIVIVLAMYLLTSCVSGRSSSKRQHGGPCKMNENYIGYSSGGGN